MQGMRLRYQTAQKHNKKPSFEGFLLMLKYASSRCIYCLNSYKNYSNLRNTVLNGFQAFNQR